MKYLLFPILLILASCRDNANSDISSIDSGGATASGSINDDTGSNKNNVSINEETSDTLINVKFPKDSTWTRIKGKMRGVTYPITVLIPVKQGKQLYALIQTEDSTANIRINQIFMPDNKADGPFGKELKYAIKQEGIYKLIIGEDKMQGEEWKGWFQLTISVR